MKLDFFEIHRFIDRYMLAISLVSLEMLGKSNFYLWLIALFLLTSDTIVALDEQTSQLYETEGSHPNHHS